MRRPSRGKCVVAFASGLSALVFAAPATGYAAAAGPTKVTSLAQAEAMWPGSTYLPNGQAHGAGSYIYTVHGLYGHLVLSTGVTRVVPAAGGSQVGSGSTVTPYALVGCSSGHNYDSCGRWGSYGCGSNVYGYVSENDWFNGTYLKQYVSYHLYICHNAWDTGQTPTCSGFGQCYGPSYGDSCQGCGTVNPWYNQVVYYANGNATVDYYLRQYMGDDSSWDTWIQVD